MTKTFLMAYQDHTIQFNEEGWINATLLAEKFNKRTIDWVRLAATRKYFSLMEDRYGKAEYIKTSRGAAGCSWLHPKMAALFLFWLGGMGVFLEISDSLESVGRIIKALNEFHVPSDLPDMYVYAIQEKETGNIKLGISRDPENRLRQMQTANSSELKLIAYRKAENRFSDERENHALAADLHVRGEWFGPGAEGVLIDAKAKQIAQPASLSN